MAMNAPKEGRVYTLTIHPSQLEQLSFENDDDRLHENIAKKKLNSIYFIIVIYLHLKD